MEIAKVECDNKRCRAPMNGSGYYVSHEKCEGGIRMAVIKSEHNPPGDWQNHYCGKQCLMLALNEIVEEIQSSAIEQQSNSAEVSDSETKELRDIGTNELPAAGEEEDIYEDSLGI